MSYIHHPYSYAVPAGMPLEQTVTYEAPMPHPAMANTMDGYIYAHPPFEMAEFYPQPTVMEDYEEYAENLSRPRLTKEQVDTLEAQFQAHPKPNSNVKRQLALQTNLTLPRVANWFQNRRAKAKQQKRQEEFERMQRDASEKASQDKTESRDDSSDSTETQEKQEEEEEHDAGKQLTPMQTPARTGDESKLSGSGSARARHQKTKSEVTREATFASLQRALNAAVAARGQYADGTIQRRGSDIEASIHNSSAFASADKSQDTPNPSFPQWESSRDSSMSWGASQSPEETFGFGSLNAAHNLHSTEGALNVPQLESPPNQSTVTEDMFGEVQFGQQAAEWGRRMQTPTDAIRHHASSDQLYNSMQFSTLQASDMASCRRGSSSEELADSFGNIGINTIRHSRSMQQLPHRTDGTTWRHPEKELDIAARRKRPRPAAIGTGSSRSLVGPPSMSPTRRIPSFGTGHHVMRHAKSHQNLGSRGYAGVRKFSAAQRSPLGISNFAEAGVFNSANVEMGSMLPPSTSSSSLAPPTPLTPEDLQHLLPSTPNESKFCASAQHDQNHLFPTTQPMQINIASPPSTPMTVDVFSQMQYQNMAPPMSAPAHYTTFPECSPCSGAPLTARSWADGAPIPSPDNSSFQSGIHMPQPTHISPMAYEQSLQPCSDADNWPLSESAPMLSPIKSSNTPPSAMSDRKATEFLIQEFPKQQEAHRFVAQQLPQQKHKSYTFANRTPSDFNHELPLGNGLLHDGVHARPM
ncbi:transcriptional regulator family: Homeodomain [Paecilomyces variotii]|nr:transcriptional regulator family: Homeodomain [Paecilomyces variotii]KAJ9240137.1 transcriptional regulator family: Homeodomain [Paecilomyces variotii]